MAICAATTKAGLPCRFTALRESSYCFSHDDRPEIIVQRRKARARGGKMHRAYVPRRPEPIELESIEDLRDLAIRITRELREGKLDIKSANALTFAVRTALHAAEIAQGAASANKRASMTPLRFEVEALKELVENGRNGRVKLQAINRLRDSGEYAVPWLVSTLQDDTQTRLHSRIIRMLPKMGKSAVNPLVIALKMGDNDTKQFIVKALGQIGYPQAIPHLLAVLEDPTSSRELQCMV